MANNNDNRILSCPDSESSSGLSRQRTQLSKHHNAPVALRVGGTDTHKRKRGRQPKTEDQKMIIPQLNSAKKTLFSDTSAKDGVNAKAYASFRSYAKAYVISNNVPTYIKSQGNPGVWEDYRNHCMNHYSMKGHKLFLEDPEHAVHKTFNLAFEAVIRNCQKVAKESQAEPAGVPEDTTADDSDDDNGAGGGEDDIHPRKRIQADYPPKRNPLPPKVISMLYKTIDPSNATPSANILFRLILTESGVENFVRSVETKFNRYVRSLHGKINFGSEEIVVPLDTFDAFISWVDLLEQTKSMPIVTVTYRRLEGEADTPPPEGFHYLAQNTKKWMDNDQTTFPPPPPHLGSDDNLPLLVGDDNNPPPSPPGGNDNNPPPSPPGGNDNLPPPPPPPLPTPPSGDNKGGQDKPSTEHEKPPIILSHMERILAQQGGLDDSEAASNLQNTWQQVSENGNEPPSTYYSLAEQALSVTKIRARPTNSWQYATWRIPGFVKGFNFFPHQAVALLWGWRQMHSRHKGGILADTMGLGKTATATGIMAIKLFEDGHCGLDSEQQLAEGLAGQIRSTLGIPAPRPYSTKKESAPEEDWSKCPSIVICPGGTIPGWIKALSKVPKLKIIILHGAAKWKDNDWKVKYKEGAELPYVTNPSDIGKFFNVPNCVVITTLQTLVRRVNKQKLEAAKSNDEERYYFFDEIKYQFMFYDEFHQLSNDGTSSFKMACRIRARYKFGLSGTPFPNDIPDMVKLPRWIGNRWTDESLKKLWDKKTLQALARNPDRTLAAKEVRKMLRDFMILRNEKSRKPDGSTIVAIPNMKLYEVDLEFTPEEQAAYDDGIAHFRKMGNFTRLNMLQQMAFAPWMREYFHDYRFVDELPGKTQDGLDQSQVPDAIEIPTGEKDDRWAAWEAKWKDAITDRTTSPVLHFVDSWVKKFGTADIKAVFFVTHPQQARFVGKYLRKRHPHIKTYGYKGSLKERLERKFDWEQQALKGSAAVIISTFAVGGVGIEFIHATHCILLTTPSTQALTAQVLGRVKRIGQLKETLGVICCHRNTPDVLYRLLQRERAPITMSIMSAIIEDDKLKAYNDLYASSAGNIASGNDFFENMASLTAVSNIEDTMVDPQNSKHSALTILINESVKRHDAAQAEKRKKLDEARNAAKRKAAARRGNQKDNPINLEEDDADLTNAYDEISEDETEEIGFGWLAK